MLFKIDIFRLQAVLACFQATVARVLKKPETDHFGPSPWPRAMRRLAQGRVKNFLRFARIARHQKAKAIKLRKILFCIRHAKKFSAPYAARLDRQGAIQL